MTAVADRPFVTPDFDHYHCRETIESVELESNTMVSILWSDGRVDRHHPWTLRENATDPKTTAVVTRERLTDIATWGDDVGAVSAEIVPHGLAITWAPDNLIGHYDLAWLRHLGTGDWHPRAIRPTLKPWDSRAGEPPTFEGPAYLVDDDVLESALNSLGTHGLIRLRNLPGDRRTVVDVGRRIGVVRPTHFGPHFDVISRLDADSQAYTGARLAPHTDIPTRECQAGLQLLHCIVNTVAGGHSLMVDGFAVAEYLRHHEPDVFDALTTLRWVWANRSTKTDIRWSAPVIALDGDVIEEIRLANTLRLFPDMDHDDVDRAYRAIRRFSRLCDDTDFRVSFPFRPGDCLIFDNRRVLHGREAFDERRGSRRLRGCYVDRDDLHSRLRMLGRAGRMADSVAH